MNSDLFRIGCIVRPHGVHGAVKLEPLTDSAARFSGLREAYLELQGQIAPVQLSVLSIAKDAVLVKLNGYDTPEAAQQLRGSYLCVDRAHAVKLPRDSYFIADLIGCAVTDTEGMSYGRITDVAPTGANDVYVIDGGKLMVPALKKLLQRVDTANKVIVFDAEVLREVGLFAN